MRRFSSVTLCAVLSVYASTAHAQRPVTCVADRAADERAIREMSQRYGAIRDVDAEMAEFSDDVWFYSPLRPDPTRGKAERRRAVEGRRAAAPGDSTIRETTGVMVSACGDMAVEHGRFVTRWRTPAGPDSTVGYYLMAFRKEHGVWKITAASVHRNTGAVPAVAPSGHPKVLLPDSGRD